MTRQGGIEHAESKFALYSDRLLLVEGRDEENLVNALISRFFGDDASIQLIAAGGIRRFPSRLQAIRVEANMRPTLKSIGVIRDADINPAGAFQNVCGQLAGVGYESPDSHNAWSDSSPSIGVFIVPSDAESGTIETLCRRSVEETAAGRCAEQYLECLAEHSAMESRNFDKTFAHAYLAATQNPVARVGEGAHQGVWNFDSPAFADLVQFIGGIN